MDKVPCEAILKMFLTAKCFYYLFYHHRALSPRTEFFCITVVSGLVLCCLLFKKGCRITFVNPALVDELVRVCWDRLARVKTSSAKKSSVSLYFWHMASINNTSKGLKRFVFLIPAVKQSW